MRHLVFFLVLFACGSPGLDTTALCGGDDFPPFDTSPDSAPSDGPADASPMSLTTPWVRHTIYAGLSGADGVNLATIGGKLSIATPWEQSAKTTISTLDAGTWTTIQLPGTVSAPEDAVFADVDGDGLLDVITVGDASKRIYVHFAPTWTLMNIDAATNVQNWLQAAFADMNGDGLRDIVAGGRVGAGAAVGYFTSPTPRVASSYTWHPIAPVGVLWSVVPRDVDNDGDMDLVISDGGQVGTDSSGMGSRWLKQTSGAWSSHLIQGYSGAGQLAHFLDVSANRVIDGSSRDTGASFVNIHETSDWNTWTTTNVPWPADAGHYNAVRPADIDGDGSLDLVVSMHHADSDPTTAPQDLSGVLWLKGPTWERGEISGVEGIKYDNLELFDVDGDGDLDVITSEQGMAGTTPAADKLGVVWYANPRGI